MLTASNLELLKSVSRSFYLSIRFLPPQMREPVALGYLLARLTDTVADAEGIEEEQRIGLLGEMQLIIGGSHDPDHAVFSEVAGSVPHRGEQRLLLRAGELVDWFRSIDRANRDHLSEVILTILHGQIWDTNYFGAGRLTACETGDDLLRYTYWVAGSVGEFWTKVGFTNLGERFAYPDKASAMLVQGRKLGQALQLINILRDLHEDLPKGRCYLPADELRAAGWDGVSRLRGDGIETVFLRWLDECEGFLENAEPYSRDIRSYRAAFCTRLPMELAGKTAARLREAGCEGVLAGKVKIRRSEVWTTMVRTGFCH